MNDLSSSSEAILETDPFPPIPGNKPPRVWTDMEALGHAADCLRLVAHPHRLRMVQMLLHDRYTVGELAAACGIRSHMASEHLRLMQRSNLLAFDREGRKTFYRVCEPCLSTILSCLETRFDPNCKPVSHSAAS